MSNEQFAQELDNSTEPKRQLAMKVAQAILESGAFAEAYPRTSNPAELKTILTRIFRKYRVSTEKGRGIFSSLAESYTGRNSHSDRSSGASVQDNRQGQQETKGYNND